jgi:hypothetical protein
MEDMIARFLNAASGRWLSSEVKLVFSAAALIRSTGHTQRAASSIGRPPLDDMMNQVGRGINNDHVIKWVGRLRTGIKDEFVKDILNVLPLPLTGNRLPPTGYPLITNQARR